MKMALNPIDMIQRALELTKQLTELRVEHAREQAHLMNAQLKIKRRMEYIRATTSFDGLKNEQERERALALAMVNDPELYKWQDFELLSKSRVQVGEAEIKGLQDELATMQTIIPNFNACYDLGSRIAKQQLESELNGFKPEIIYGV
jgi:hypothetical protein